MKGKKSQKAQKKQEQAFIKQCIEDDRRFRSKLKKMLGAYNDDMFQAWALATKEDNDHHA